MSYFTVDAIDTEWGKSNKIASSSILGSMMTMNKYINKLGSYRMSQFLGRLIRSPGSLRRRKGSGALKAEIGVWNSQGG